MLKFFIRLFWASFLFLMLPWTMQGQSFPYVVSVQTVQGLCYDDSHIIVTLTDNSGHVVQIDPETHNAVDMNSYPLSNVQYYYQNVTAGTTLQYSYSNDIVVPAGTYLVGVVVNIPGANGVWTNVDVPYGNVAVTTQYNHLEAMVLDLANANYLGHERCGMHPSLSCVACGRIQLKLVNGRFPYHVVILDEQNDTVRDVTYSQRVQSGSNASYADFRDYYTFDSMAVGNYTIFISDACNYSVRLSAIIPDVSPWGYEFYFNPNKKCEESDNILFFAFSVRNSGTTGSLKNYMHPYLSNTMQYCFVHSGQDTTAWRQMQFNDSYDGGGWIYIYDTLESGLRVCEIMDDTLQFLIKDMCLDSVFVTKWHIVSGFFLKDSMRIVPYNGIETPDTCSIHVSNGISTQSYLFYGNINNSSGWNVSYSDRVITVASRYYGCPLFFNAWSLPDSTLLAHGESNDFNGFGVPISIAADTTLSVHIAISDVHDCVLAEFDTTLTFQTSQAEDIDYWWECGHYDTPNNWFVCCENRYMWLQEHLVEADSFRRNMTLHLIESPLYNRFNFTAVRQDGVWTVNNDDPNNTSTSVEFSYEDGWRATIRDAECLSPGRYVFEIHNDCGDTIISYQWNGYYTDSTFLVSTPQYNAYQVCDQFVIPTNDVSIVRNYYHIYPDIDNNVPQIQTSQPRYYFTVRGHSNNVFFYVESYEPYIILSQPGVYSIDLTTNAGSDCSRLFYSDTVSFTQTFLKFDFANAYICDVSSSTGMVLAQAINGNKPYTFNLYDQWNANGNVIATSDTGFFNNVPMMAGQHLSVLVTDSCNNSFSVNLTASALTQENLIMSVGDSIHCEGDTLHLEAKQFPFPTSYQWTGPNGFSDTSRVIDVHIPYGSESGWYRVDITNSLCGNTLSDSIYITVTPAPRVTILGDTIVCPDRQIILDFIPHGTGTVNFDILQSDNNLRTHYSVAAGDTVQQSLQILSNIVFWADSIFDEACAYHSFIDSFPVLMRVLDYNPTHVYDTVLENNLPFGIYDTVFQNAGTYEITLSDQFGCDSAVFVHLTVLYNVTAVDDSVVCFSALPLTWNNTVFRADMMDTLAGSSVPIITHPGVLTASNGVDSTVTMTLYVNPAYSLADTATVCADELPYIWNGVTFTEAGTQYVTLPTIDGCDSIIAMTLVVKPLYAVTDTAVICADELPYTWNGVAFTEAGTQSATLPTVYGCDSVVAMTLLVNPTYSVTDTAVICANELPLTWNGVTFTGAGTRSATLPTVDGCDSVVAMTLVVLPMPEFYDTLHLVQNQMPYHFLPNDTILTLSSTFIQFQYSHPAEGCDSIFHQTVFVHLNTTQQVDTVVCAASLPTSWHGHLFTGNASFTDTLQTVFQSDSVVTYSLTVTNISADIGNIVQVVCFGDSTGSASATFSGGNAPLTLRWTNAANTPVSSTDSLGGQPAGFYTFTVTDNLGCSASDTVTLRNLHATMAPGAVSEDQDLCEGNTPDPFLGTPASGGADGHYLWQINLNGTDWVAAPGTNNAQNYTYPDSVTGSFSLRRAWISAACGTVFSNTVTINVWMNHHDTVEANVCQDEPFQDFGFDIGADETDEVGLQTFTQLLPSSHCDSTLTLLLTVNPKYEALIEENVCEGDGYFLNGFSVNHQETMGVDELTRELTLQSASGCDSIVRLHLSVIDTSLHIESSTDDFCERLSAELMAVTEMTDYLWNTGETSQEITVTQPGLYRVTAYQGQCNRTASYHVETCHTDLHLPNSITPVHSSGLNDYFSIPEMFQQSIRRFEIRIYDRWGELVFHSTDKNFKWRGECKGQIQHNSIFNYIILFTDKMGNHQVKGSLLVL